MGPHPCQLANSDLEIGVPNGSAPQRQCSADGHELPGVGLAHVDPLGAQLIGQSRKLEPIASLLSQKDDELRSMAAFR